MLRMNKSSQQQNVSDFDSDSDTAGSHGIDVVSTDIPDALGLGCEEKKKNGVHPKNGNNVSVPNLKCSVARMSVDRNAEEYNMNHKKRGFALIFNHEEYEIPYLVNRKGTNIDAERLKETFENLHFEVTIHKDCTLKVLLEHIEAAASYDHSDNDCIAIAILTHGENGYLYAKDVMYKLESVSHHFTAQECKTLAGKPKLFFIQACRGDGLDPGVKLQKTETDGETLSEMSYRIPVHADFLMAYSTIPGFYSWRNPTNGTWFIQSLITELNNNGKKHDILTILTFVNRRVATDFESCESRPLFDKQKQIPCVTSMLTRILRFTDKTQQN